MPLPTVLRTVAGLIVGMVIGEYFVLDVLMIPPLGVVAVLLLLSFTYDRWPVATARIAAVLSVVVPIGALNGYLQGKLVLLVPIFDAVIFAWLLWTSVRELRLLKSAEVS
ncbi:MAG: hypothetical protein AAF660_06170 [Pseudomonadota bacterium]